ncbi:MAG: CBS domain-containing protein [Flavobacteriaceae bacterium]|nr:CBS domain-containing protein [Flavobacteriaceae bacterium]
MKKRAPVSNIMTKNLVKLNLGDSLTKAESLFKRNKIRHLPVVNASRIVGMLSYTDLLRISFADATDSDGEEIETTVYDMFSIEQVMTSKVVSVTSDASIKDVAEILVSNEFHAIPVTENDQLVGIVTSTDVIRYLLEQYN